MLLQLILEFTRGCYSWQDASHSGDKHDTRSMLTPMIRCNPMCEARRIQEGPLPSRRPYFKMQLLPFWITRLEITSVSTVGQVYAQLSHIDSD